MEALLRKKLLFTKYNSKCLFKMKIQQNIQQKGESNTLAAHLEEAHGTLVLCHGTPFEKHCTRVCLPLNEKTQMRIASHIIDCLCAAIKQILLFVCYDF